MSHDFPIMFPFVQGYNCTNGTCVRVFVGLQLWVLDLTTWLLGNKVDPSGNTFLRSNWESKWLGTYPPVNVYITMENHHAING